MSRPMEFQVDGKWFPATDIHGLVEGESPIEEAQRLAHLREAKAREAEKFRCHTCGMPGALTNGGDRYHGPGLCNQRGGAS